MADFRFDLAGLHFHIGLTRSKQVEGVNSELEDGTHFLMWDFDDVFLEKIVYELLRLQYRFELSNIYLINTGLPEHYHAYCFKSFTYPDTLRILSSTPCIDKIYFKIGVVRGYFTLRYSEKEGRILKLAMILPSPVKEDVDPGLITNVVKYWTKRV